jgi:hypothetical protein
MQIDSAGKTIFNGMTFREVIFQPEGISSHLCYFNIKEGI